VGSAVEKIVQQASKKLRGVHHRLRGQVIPWRLVLPAGLGCIRRSAGLSSDGRQFSVVARPVHILMALPGALAGIVWMLFITRPLSVCLADGLHHVHRRGHGNSILLVVFANDQREEGMDAGEARFQRIREFRPVLMTAAAMIIGSADGLGMEKAGNRSASRPRVIGA